MRSLRLFSRVRLGRKAGIVTALLVFTGSALGYYAEHGTGVGAAAGASVIAVAATPATAAAGLTPGTSSELAVTISSSNPAPVHIGSLQLDTSRGTSGFGVDAAHRAACTAPALTFTTQNDGGDGWDVPAKTGSTNGTLTLHLADAVAMGASADNGCQGAVFDVYLKAGS